MCEFELECTVKVRARVGCTENNMCAVRTHVRCGLVCGAIRDTCGAM